jgi:ABC-type glutathione transport system ATPase component
MNGPSIKEPILELRNIVFGYRLRKGENIRIFDDLSLDVKYAEFIGIAGPKL